MIQQVSPSDPVRLDRAVQEVSSGTHDPVTKAQFDTLQGAMAACDVAPEGIDPPSMIGALFTHLMPHIRNPSVLLPEQRRTILKRLEARATARGDSAPIVPGGVDSLRHELENLEEFMRNRNGLIGG
ncbi:hypothetical protein [Kozakia baliensis]|uniref:Uncharacterized protein n=1 Tax=Kozakia baliensis TaxID=153496 RepID=A0A1D8USN7_9PROT|nr:hypothetical protein [Kozakia baliensis]AOX16641.1 hypothetical protein A0U89_05320 [Kozakia baliensis]GBR26030.1 hypothetical protein AA0488_0805 [Kozakia baliensis NRIC 0488]GEL65250.1 hypothetical protein KBA01_25360 [Kozakia baliensis]